MTSRLTEGLSISERKTTVPLYSLRFKDVYSRAKPCGTRRMNDRGNDISIAHAHLCGYSRPMKNGLMRKMYFEEGSDWEIQARTALSGLLRSDMPLPREIRESLADLFAPSPPAHSEITRRIKFVARRRGKEREDYNDSQIGFHVYEQMRAGTTYETAVKATTEKFGFTDDRMVKRHFSRFRKTWELAFGKLSRAKKVAAWRPPLSLDLDLRSCMRFFKRWFMSLQRRRVM